MHLFTSIFSFFISRISLTLTLFFESIIPPAETGKSEFIMEPNVPGIATKYLIFIG